MTRLATHARVRLAATLGLLAVTAVWGATFVVVKDAIARMPVLDFLAWRFGIAAAVMAAVRPRALRALPRAGRRAGVILGGALAAGYLAQTFGLRTTPASVSGFITGMFVVFTPLAAGLLLRHHVGAVAWVGVALACAGLALLSLHGLSVGSGELLTVVCALAFALHIVGLGEWSARYDAAGLAVIQLATVAVLCTLAAVPGGLHQPPDFGVWAALGITALLGTAAAFWVQTAAQAHLSPTRAAVVLTMEPVFAGLFGVTVAHDRVTGRTIAGALLVVIAMLVVEAGPRHGADAEVRRLES